MTQRGGHENSRVTRTRKSRGDKASISALNQTLRGGYTCNQASSSRDISKDDLSNAFRDDPSRRAAVPKHAACVRGDMVQEKDEGEVHLSPEERQKILDWDDFAAREALTKAAAREHDQRFDPRDLEWEQGSEKVEEVFSRDSFWSCNLVCAETLKEQIKNKKKWLVKEKPGCSSPVIIGLPELKDWTSSNNCTPLPLAYAEMPRASGWDDDEKKGLGRSSTQPAGTTNTGLNDRASPNHCTPIHLARGVMPTASGWDDAVLASENSSMQPAETSNTGFKDGASADNCVPLHHPYDKMPIVDGWGAQMHTSEDSPMQPGETTTGLKDWASSSHCTPAHPAFGLMPTPRALDNAVPATQDSSVQAVGTSSTGSRGWTSSNHFTPIHLAQGVMPAASGWGDEVLPSPDASMQPVGTTNTEEAILSQSCEVLQFTPMNENVDVTCTGRPEQPDSYSCTHPSGWGDGVAEPSISSQKDDVARGWCADEVGQPIAPAWEAAHPLILPRPAVQEDAAVPSWGPHRDVTMYQAEYVRNDYSQELFNSGSEIGLSYPRLKYHQMHGYSNSARQPGFLNTVPSGGYIRAYTPYQNSGRPYQNSGRPYQNSGRSATRVLRSGIDPRLPRRMSRSERP